MGKYLIFCKQQWHVHEENPFYSDPGSLVNREGFAGDFLYNTFLQLQLKKKLKKSFVILKQ